MVSSITETEVNPLTLGERIKKVRKELDFTQQAFGKKIGMKQNTIALIEGGRGTSDQTIYAICREFNVNETWLRTGEGEMFVKQDPKDELAAAVDRLITGESAEFKRRLVVALSSIKDEHWTIIEQKLNEIVGRQNATPAFAPVSELEGKTPIEPEPQQDVSQTDPLVEIMAMDVADMTDEEYRLYTEEVRRQAIAKKKAAENASASQDATWNQKMA